MRRTKTTQKPIIRASGPIAAFVRDTVGHGAEVKTIDWNGVSGNLLIELRLRSGKIVSVSGHCSREIFSKIFSDLADLLPAQIHWEAFTEK